MLRTVLTFCLIAAVVLQVAGSAARAQVARGEVFGTVLDSQNAAIPGADVRAISEGQGFQYRTASNAEGLYTLPGLIPGAYRIQVDKAGFSTHVRSGVVVQGSRRQQVNVTLQVVAVSEAVEVREDAPMLEKGSSEIGQTIGDKKVLSLPINGRNYLQLATLSTNSVPMDTFGSRQGTNYILGGSRWNANGLYVDGIDNNTIFFNRDTVRPSLDSVQELRVITNSPSAEYGRNMGGLLVVITRAGSNEFHGSLFEYFRNNRLNARNAFSATASPFFVQNQFGASLGGPVIKNRLFFFSNFELRINPFDVATNLLVPPTAWRSGDLTGARIIHDPATTRPDPGAAGRTLRDPFPQNRIPALAMDRVGARIGREAWPVANFGTNVFRADVRRRFEEGQQNFRGDWQIDNQNQLTLRYTRYRTESLNNTAIPLMYTNADLPINTGHNAMATWTRNVSASAVNELRLGFNRFRVDQTPLNFGTDPTGEIGLRGTSPSKEFSAFPTMLTGFAQIGAGSTYVQSAENIYQISNNLSWFRARHRVKLGGDIRQLQATVKGGFHPFGLLEYGALLSSAPGVANTGEPFADLLLGFPQSIQAADAAAPIYGREMIAGLFLQDDWQVSRKLSLNLGLRYEIFTVPVDRWDRQSNVSLDVPSGQFRVASPNKSLNELQLNAIRRLNLTDAERNRLFVAGESRALARNNWLDFSPRFGFTWTPLTNTVLRGGFGVYRTSVGGGTFPRLGFNPPNYVEVALAAANAIAPIARLQDGIPSPSSGPIQIQRLSTRHTDENRRTGLNMQFNLTLQQQLDRDTVLELGFVGSRGRNLSQFQLTNQIRLQQDYGKGQSARPVPGLGDIWTWSTLGSSLYTAGNVRVERRLRAGWTALALYTWARAMDQAPGDSAIGGVGRSVAPIDAFDMAREYGPSLHDVNHRFVTAQVYQLPFGQSRRWLNNSRLLDYVAGGWTISNILNWQTGLPLDAKLQTNRVFSFNNQNRPDRLADGNVPSGQRRAGFWWDPAAFRLPPDFVLGNSGRNVLRAPGLFTLDVTIGKDFRFTERYRLEFRSEFYNLTNTVNLGAPNGLVGNAAFGQIFSSRDARQVQLALRFAF